MIRWATHRMTDAVEQTAGGGMEFKPNITEVTERYRAFWNRSKLDRIPIRIRVPAGNLQAHESYLESAVATPLDHPQTWEEIALIRDRYFAYWENQLEAARLVLMAERALEEEGFARPKAHMAALQGGDILTLLLARRPFDAEEVARLGTWSD